MLNKVVKLKDNKGTVVILDKIFNNGQYSGTTIYVAHQLDVRDGNYILSTKDNSIFTITIKEISKLQSDQLVIGL